MKRSIGLAALVLMLLCTAACSVCYLAGYAVWPDYPEYGDGEVIMLDGLEKSVQVVQREDGLWKIDTENENDLMMMLGYLQARDRMAQMDLMRHLAEGRLTELTGNKPFGKKSALDVDKFNRFLGTTADARRLLGAVSAQERTAIDAYVKGVNLWIAEGELPLEHRLLGVDKIRPWEAIDSMAIFRMIMWGLSSNYSREIRRLVIACDAGVHALERIWPTHIDLGIYALPSESYGEQKYALYPGVVSEMVSALPALCAKARQTDVEEQQGAALDAGAALPVELARLLLPLIEGYSASNNWVVSGKYTASGKPILSSDPHIPHMNPPILWGYDGSIPGKRFSGFTFPGLHRMVFGHNGLVAWGITTNHVDRQDLVVHRQMFEQTAQGRVEGYEVDGAFRPFEIRQETFAIKGEEPVTLTARFTVDGPLLNDLEPHLTGIPLTALRKVDLGHGTDLESARQFNYATNAEEFAKALLLMDSGCSNWIYADIQGDIGYISPCVVPVRKGYLGTFPVPGWLSKYHWQGTYDKSVLPTVVNPQRGWLATANSRIIPPDRFPGPYNNDSSPPNRYLRIKELLAPFISGKQQLTVEQSSHLQLDTIENGWTIIRKELSGKICDKPADGATDKLTEAITLLCNWDGDMNAESPAATLFVLLTNAMLDRALADEMTDGADGENWKFVLSVLQFEADVNRLWLAPTDDKVWDDMRTPEIENKFDIIGASIEDALAFGTERYGDDFANWRWGDVRPFVLRHMFAGNDGVLGAMFNADPLPGVGGVTTVFKNHFARSDREKMNPTIGPAVRFTIDMADPYGAVYTLAGGESGWPSSPYYANLLPDWRYGRNRPLTPPPSDNDLHLKFVPRR